MTLNALLLEQDPATAALFVQTLAAEEIPVTCCNTLPEGLHLLAHHPFELVFVGRGPEPGSRLEFVRLARSLVPAVGIIVLSNQELGQDRIAGLESGADEYLEKPFNWREVAMRARRLGSRAAEMMRNHSGLLLKFLNFTLDPLERTLHHGLAGPIHLTGREFDLLHCLARSGSSPQSRKSLRCMLHGRDPHTTDRTIDTLISHIRRKLRAVSGADPVRTVRSQGYAFGAAVTSWPHPGQIASRA
ncbi:MAG: response regulator transcription factor [Betaproteobacteria bacterium]|nr:response regulator transcription factor [Betaproteobacteria bacterium]